MKTSNQDLNEFLKKYKISELHDSNIRNSPKQVNSDRIKKSFIEKSLNDTLKKNINPDYSFKKNILFSHFSPFLTEIEGLGLPLYTKIKFPNSKIHFTYDKGNKDSVKYKIDKEGNIILIHELSKSYDIIIARSSSLINMSKRKKDMETLTKSKSIINIKTMSYKPNYKMADYYFDEEDMCPPPDPCYLNKVNNFMKNRKKENLIVMSGTLWYVKNQLNFLKNLDSSIIKNYELVIMGPERQPDYVKDIRGICKEKKIKYYLIGNVNKNLAALIKSLAKISLIPMDMTVFGQPKGYPRTLGESIGSKCLTLCNDVITVPSFYKNSVITYNEKIKNDQNRKLKKCIEVVEKENFLSEHEWGDDCFYKFCQNVLEKCFSISNIN
jgi:hypothetical protein